MAIYLHIGSTKTGSTSIQEFMVNNAQVLRNKGVYYPAFLGDKRLNVSNHTRLVGYAINADKSNVTKISLGMCNINESIKFRMWFEELFKSKVFHKDRTYVMSNEHCSALLTNIEEIQRLYDLLSSTGHVIKIIFYAREQVSYLLSSYSTHLKNGSTSDLGYPSPHAINDKYNYLSIMNKWATVFGHDNVIVRIFERESLIKGDVIHDFLSVVGGEYFDLDGLVFENIKNEALGTKSALFMKHFNKLFPRLVDGKLNRNRGRISKYIEKVEHGHKIICPENLSLKLRNELQTSNKNFNKLFVDGKLCSPFVFKQTSTEAKIIEEEELTKSDLMNIWASIYAQQFEDSKK
jgi:hypothetical protein